MKPVFFHSLFAGMTFLGIAAFSFALPTGAPSVDIHPYQSQTSFRTNDARMGTGLVESLPAVSVPEWKYLVSGSPMPQIAHDTSLMYDKRTIVGPTVIAGGNYAFDASGYMYTITGDGFYFSKNKTLYKPIIVGGVYFVDSANHHVIAVDSYGSVFDTLQEAPAIHVAGGNYYIDSKGVLTTFKSMGFSQTDVSGLLAVKKFPTDLNFPGVTQAGGNYFFTRDNQMVTISAKTGYYDEPFTPDALPRLLGGNYFVGTDNLLYTVDNDGVVAKKTEYVVGNVAVRGSSFLVMADGSFIFVDGSGSPHRSSMHVGLNANSSAPITLLPEAIDPNSIYLPKVLN